MTKHERYNRTEKGRERWLRYTHTANGRAQRERYNAKRRLAAIQRREELIRNSTHH